MGKKFILNEHFILNEDDLQSTTNMSTQSAARKSVDQASEEKADITDPIYWKNKYDNLAGGALELKNFWSEYFKNYFPGYEKDIDDLGSALKKEIINYDFETEANPFFGYLKYICENSYGKLPALPCYTAIHNAFVKKYITRLNLAGAFTPKRSNNTKEWGQTVDLLFNKNFFIKNTHEALNLLKLQDNIGKKIKNLKQDGDLYKQAGEFIELSGADTNLETYIKVLFFVVNNQTDLKEKQIIKVSEIKSNFKTIKLTTYNEAVERWEKLSNEKVSEAKKDWVKEKSINSIIEDNWTEKYFSYTLKYLYTKYEDSLKDYEITLKKQEKEQKISVPEIIEKLEKEDKEITNVPEDISKKLDQKFNNYEIDKNKDITRRVFLEFCNAWLTNRTKEANNGDDPNQKQKQKQASVDNAPDNKDNKNKGNN